MFSSPGSTVARTVTFSSSSELTPEGSGRAPMRQDLGSMVHDGGTRRMVPVLDEISLLRPLACAFDVRAVPVRTRTATKMVHEGWTYQSRHSSHDSSHNWCDGAYIRALPFWVLCRRETLAFSRKRPRRVAAVEPVQVRVLVADSGPIQSQLLARALRAQRNFRVSTVALEVAVSSQCMQSNPADVVLIAGTSSPTFGLLRWLHVAYPATATVLLVESYDRELVVNAFRVGAQGHLSLQPRSFSHALASASVALPRARSGSIASRCTTCWTPCRGVTPCA